MQRTQTKYLNVSFFQINLRICIATKQKSLFSLCIYKKITGKDKEQISFKQCHSSKSHTHRHKINKKRRCSYSPINVSSDTKNKKKLYLDIYSISLYISSISFSKYFPNSGRFVFIVGVKRLFSIENCSG